MAGSYGLNQADIYGNMFGSSESPTAAETAQPEQVQLPVSSDKSVTVSWLGVLMTLVLIRVVFEFAE